MIEKVEWTDEALPTLKAGFQKFQDSEIAKVAHVHCRSYFDDRVNPSKVIKKIKAFGVVGLYIEIIDNTIEEKLSYQKLFLEEFSSLSTLEQDTINKLLSIQKNIADNIFNIYQDYRVEKSEQENVELAAELDTFKETHARENN